MYDGDSAGYFTCKQTDTTIVIALLIRSNILHDILIYISIISIYIYMYTYSAVEFAVLCQRECGGGGGGKATGFGPLQCHHR